MLRLQQFDNLFVTMATSYVECSLAIVVLVINECPTVVLSQEQLDQLLVPPHTGIVQRGSPHL